MLTDSFFVSEIAQWALPDIGNDTEPRLRVQLPALQRGAVWSAAQVERLWDSLVRGFPIGCLILSEPQTHLGSKPFALQKGMGQKDVPEHLLLDGQQRSTSIAIGFLNPWREISHEEKAEFALWLDLEPPAQSSQVRHVFRLLTRSHPWGYQRQNPTERLSTSARRNAMQEYEQSARALGLNNLIFRPGHLPLSKCWPHDARAPVPVSCILDAVRRLPSDASDAAIWKTVSEVCTEVLAGHVDWISGNTNEATGRSKIAALLRDRLSSPTDHMNYTLFRRRPVSSRLSYPFRARKVSGSTNFRPASSTRASPSDARTYQTALEIWPLDQTGIIRSSDSAMVRRSVVAFKTDLPCASCRPRLPPR